MCISLILAATSVAIGAASGAMSMRSASSNRDAEQMRLTMESRQMREQLDGERLAAAQQERLKSDEFEAARSSALAAIGASGIGEHISFFQGADPASRAAFGRDVASLRLNLGESESRIRNQIKVNDLGMDVARVNANTAKVGALTDFMQTGMQAYSFYSKYNVPTKKAA